MFFNNRVSILSQGEDRQLTEIYSNAKAMIYKKRQSTRLDPSIAENTVKEILVVCLEADKILVKAGNIVRYEDSFGRQKEVKAGEPELVDALYFKKLIELKCDLL